VILYFVLAFIGVVIAAAALLEWWSRRRGWDL
jgi:hypothetical protein